MLRCNFACVDLDTTTFNSNIPIYRFLRQFLLYFFLHQMSLALFRVMGSLGRTMIVANTFGSFAMMVVMGLGGYVISRGKWIAVMFLISFICVTECLFIFLIKTDSISRWWIWGFWISPLMYAQNAASVNEFLGHSWNKVIFFRTAVQFLPQSLGM